MNGVGARASRRLAGIARAIALAIAALAPAGLSAQLIDRPASQSPGRDWTGTVGRGYVRLLGPQRASGRPSVVDTAADGTRYEYLEGGRVLLTTAPARRGATAPVAVYLDAIEPVRVGSGSVTPTLVAACEGGRTTAAITTTGATERGEAWSGRTGVRILSRSGVATSELWNIDARGDTFAPQDARFFLRSSVMFDTLRVEFEPRRGPAQLARFDTEALRRNLERVASACGWTFDPMR